MIGRLRGTLLVKQPPQLLIDVNGVGYEVEAPMSTFYNLPELNATVTLHTHLVVRDDAHILFGFGSLSERSMFRSLIKVNGVGAKLALAILSGMSAEEFARCVQENSVTALTRLPGIGKKTAERLIVEMRDKLGDVEATVSLPGAASAATEIVENPIEDAVSALIALGYKPNEASRMVRAVASDEASSEELIRLALQSMVKG